jgi:hypothetical protein
MVLGDALLNNYPHHLCDSEPPYLFYSSGDLYALSAMPEGNPRKPAGTPLFVSVAANGREDS